ncbi:uncharacterized protein LOC127468897 [Manacus candei]|uniref:uncharacterized protein LOC127468897 n=1 Tax=Manacus candei TaxID=415023 RepID=UPI0022280650|nr:uncharacterized protein LOC127468897 [Manacus candei]
MPSAECQTDHRLVHCKLNFNLTFKPKRVSIPRRRLQVNNLQSATVRDRFQANLQTRLENHSIDSADSSPETIWHHIKNSILQSSEESLGFSFKKNKNWFDENNQEIQELLRKKRTAHQAHLALPSYHARKTAFRLACSKLQQKLRDIQNKWWIDLAEKTQLCADNGDHRRLYEALKTAYGPTYQVQSPLLSTDGQTLLTDKTSILNRWSEHFQTLFKTPELREEALYLILPNKEGLVGDTDAKDSLGCLGRVMVDPEHRKKNEKKSHSPGLHEGRLWPLHRAS